MITRFQSTTLDYSSATPIDPRTAERLREDFAGIFTEEITRCYRRPRDLDPQGSSSDVEGIEHKHIDGANEEVTDAPSVLDVVIGPSMRLERLVVAVPLEEMERLIRARAIAVPLIQVVALATWLLARALNHPRKQIVQFPLLPDTGLEGREDDDGVVVHVVP